MDRFFSKLDLRDIKIKPEGSRFLPDDDDAELSDEATAPSLTVEEESIDQFEPEQNSFASATGNGHVVSASYERITVEEWDIEETNPPVEQQNSVATRRSDDTEVLKESAKSRPSAVAGAIAGVVRETGRAEVQAIGAGATNQAVKAIAIAREYLLETDIDAICVPAFIDVTIDNEERTAIRLVIERR
jgi:stage V sporulation protein S